MMGAVSLILWEKNIGDEGVKYIMDALIQNETLVRATARRKFQGLYLGYDQIKYNKK